MPPLSASLSRAEPQPTGSLARVAADRLRRTLTSRHDGAVLADLVEEDLGSALDHLEAVRAHLEDVVGVLLSDRPRPLDLLEAGDDRHAQGALAELEAALQGLNRRLAQAAARLAAPLDRA